MKQYIFAAVILLNVAFQKCQMIQLLAQASDIPACIQVKIDSIKQQPRWNPPAKVEEYNYNNRRVFFSVAIVAIN